MTNCETDATTLPQLLEAASVPENPIEMGLSHHKSQIHFFLYLGWNPALGNVLHQSIKIRQIQICFLI